MSSLEWAEAVYTPYSDPSHLVELWELWIVGQDRKAWYNLPVASVEKIGDRQWRLTFTEFDMEPQVFTTLKAAKAMGIALYRMDTNG